MNVVSELAVKEGLLCKRCGVAFGCVVCECV